VEVASQGDVSDVDDLDPGYRWYSPDRSADRNDREVAKEISAQ
jgi:hypothetical protein